MHDELDDVDLRGKKLVSADPTKWKIPDGMSCYESVLDWWRRLVQVETTFHPEVIHACQGAIALWETQAGWFKERIIGHVNTLLNHGFTLQQIEDATSIPMGEVFGPTLQRCWERIHKGDPLEEILEGLSATKAKHVRLWHGMLNGIPKKANYARRNPQMRDFALELWDMGVNRAEICRRIKDRFGEDIRPDTVSQWVHRRTHRIKQALKDAS